MRAPGRLPLAWIVGAALWTAGGAGAESPVVYKWVDEHGVAHYTTDRDRIPASIRDRVEQRGGSATRGADWLTRDATAAPEPGVAVRGPEPLRSEPPATREERAPEAEESEVGAASEPHDTVDSYREPAWEEAPGAEAAYAPHDLGESGSPPSPGPTGDATPGSAAEATAELPVEPEIGAPELAPTPPVEASGQPIEGPGVPASEEPPAPAAVAAPAPLPLGPEESAELAEIDRRISALEGEIARDEEALMALISVTDDERQRQLVDDPAFREISQRLPKRQAELQALRERRGRIEPSPLRQ
jgi:hypothetical protein